MNDLQQKPQSNIGAVIHRTDCCNYHICKCEGCIVHSYTEGCKCYNCTDCSNFSEINFCKNDRVHSVSVKFQVKRKIAQGIIDYNLDKSCV